MPWVTWKDGEPNFGRGRTVVFDIPSQKHLVSDVNLVPAFCEVDEIPRFRLRGLCEDSNLDTYFILRLEGNIIQPLFLGYTSTKIQPSKFSRQTWQIVDATDETVLASTNLTQDEQNLFPTGRRRWTFHPPTKCTTNSSVPWREMNLHLAVEQPGHFCCGDGTCVSSEFRCDNNHDCVDASDEQECRMLQPPNYNYNPDLPPQVMVTKMDKRVFPKGQFAISDPFKS